MSAEFIIEEELKKLPGKPGVYIMYDRHDVIIYVGKAVSLKNRVRQYFQSSRGKSPKVVQMVSRIDHFEYIVTDSELEALVLESNLIKEHRPKYNTMLKDDKSYPYICVTLGEAFPRILVTRSMRKDSSRYYGPYPTAGAVRDTIDLLRKLYRIRSCDRKLPETMGRERPCLYHHIGQCDAPGQGLVTEEAYRRQVDGAVAFLNGDVRDEIAALTKKMADAAADLRFEEAAAFRDLIDSIRIVSERQKITASDGDDRDIIAVATDAPKPDSPGSEEAEEERTGAEQAEETARTGIEAVVQVFFVRGGKLIGREHFFLTAEDKRNEAQILSSFIAQYYAGTPFVPKELMVETEPEDLALLETWLTERRGSKVQFRVPRRGMME